MDWIVTSDEIGELFGVQQRQVYNFVKQGMPKAGKGKFHAPSCLQWFVDDRSTGGAADINEQRKLLYKAQTDKTELENHRLRGDLLEFNAVQAVLFELATLVSTQIDSVEPRLARKLPPDVVEELRAELKTIRESVAHAVETHSTTRDDSRDHPSAS